DLDCRLKRWRRRSCRAKREGASEPVRANAYAGTAPIRLREGAFCVNPRPSGKVMTKAADTLHRTARYPALILKERAAGLSLRSCLPDIFHWHHADEVSNRVGLTSSKILILEPVETSAFARIASGVVLRGSVSGACLCHPRSLPPRILLPKWPMRSMRPRSCARCASCRSAPPSSPAPLSHFWCWDIC